MCRGPSSDTGTLLDLLEQSFYHSFELSQDSVTFNSLLERNLGLLARMEIEWTDHLDDHLRLRNDNSTVPIYHHATPLECDNRYVFENQYCDGNLLLNAPRFTGNRNH